MLRNKSPVFMAATILVTGLCGCDRYIDRRDQVTFGGGDAVAANKAAQIIDPWPVAARTIEHGISGEQAEAAIQRMRRSSTEKPPASGLAQGAAPAAPPAAPGTMK